MERAMRFFRPLQFCTAVGRDGSPGARPFQMMYAEGNDLYYCTGAKKEVYAELSADPRLELCASTSERRVRICGRNRWKAARRKSACRRRARRCAPSIKARTTPT